MTGKTRMRATLRQLRVFEAVSRLGSVSAAAVELNVTQSAASLALQQLEITLGGPLFKRSSRQLAITASGRRLQPKVRSILNAVDELEDSDARDLSGLLSIGATNMIATYLLPRLCSSFQDRHPEVQFRILAGNDRQIIDGVENMALDVGFMESLATRQSLRTLPWIEDEAVVVAAADHWAVGRRLSVKELESAYWFLPPFGSALRYAIGQDFRAIGPLRFEANSAEVIKKLVLLGRGIACLSRLEVADEVRRGEMACLDIHDFPTMRRFSINFRRDVGFSALHSAFVEHATQFRPPS